MKVNQIAKHVANAGNHFPMKNFTLGAFNDGSTRWMEVDIGEVVYFSTSISDAVVATYVAELQTRWDIA
jgi:hypothetical protein